MIRKKVISIMMSAAMLCTNIIPAMQVMAVEAPAVEESQVETEETKHNVIVEKVSGLTYDYENGHYQKNDGSGNDILSYSKDEKVNLTLSIAGDYMLERIQSVSEDGKDVPMEWTSENKIRFTMPASDVHVQAVTVIRPTESEEPAKTPELTEEVAVVNDTETAEEQLAPTENVPETAQEMVEPDPGNMAETDVSTEAFAASAETSDTNADAGHDESFESAIDTIEAVAETEKDNTQAADVTAPDTAANTEETVSTDNAQGEDADKTADISETLMEILEEDGFPAQGSVVKLPAMEISIETASIVPENSFDEVSYPQNTVAVKILSDETIYGISGTYDVMYRADESTTGKFWYIVRPVTVRDTTAESAKAADNKDSENGSDEEEDSSDEEDPDDPASEEESDIETMMEEPAEETSEESAANGSDLEEVNVEVETEDLSEAEDVPDETDHTDVDADEEYDLQEEGGQVEERHGEAVTAGQEMVTEQEETVSPQNIYFDTTEGYSISMENDRVTYQPGEDVSFTVTASENYAIKTAAAFVAITEDSQGEGDEVENENAEPSPILITDEAVAMTRTAAVSNDEKIVEATYEFEMPEESVVLSANVMLAAASNDVTVQLDNGGIKNIPKSWTPDGQTWANGGTTIGYTRYRTVTMPDGKERKAYCLQPALGAEEDGEYTATEIRKKGKISAAEATTLRKAVFYCYGGPGWATGEIKDILSDCSTNDEYYVATHYILSKIYCDATSGDWNVATSGGIDYVAVNAKGKAQIEAAVAKIRTLSDPDASLSPTQVTGVYNEATGFAYTQAVTYASTVTGNTMSITLPANVYLDIAGGASFSPGQKAQIPPGSTFTLRKNGYEAAHQETLTCKAAIFTDFDAYLINVGATRQNMGFSYVADKGFELSVNWPDLFTHLNIVKVDAHTGTATATPGYNIDGAVYGIYADAARTQLLEQLTITGGSAVSSDNFVIGKTYYVAEISAPAEYTIDTNVYPVMAAAGGTATVTSSDVPKAIQISMQKVDAETGEPRPLTSALSFEGAVFGVFSDENCSVKAVDISGNEIADIRTDANGHAQTPQTLLIGDYYVKELAAPAGYLMNETVFKVGADQVRSEIINQDANVELTCEEQVIRANMDLMKVKTLKGLNTEAAEGVEFYFTYVNDPTVTFTVVPGRENTVITDAEGYATTKSDAYPNGTLIYGEWQITEGNTPEGFEPIDPTTFTINGDGRTYRFVANNRQIHAAVLIEKHDANTGSLIPVEGVKFKLYKDGELVSLFNPATRVYEDTWITDVDGMVQLPEMLDYGTYTVVEDPESIPDGYFVMDDTPLVVDEMADEYLHPITLTAMEPPQLGNIMVEKRDAKTDEPLEGFAFEIMAAEDITDPVGVIRTGMNADGEEVPLTAGTIVERMTTGKNGNAVSKDLFLGKYTIRETGIVNGYAIAKETPNVTVKGDAAKARNHENVSEYVLFRNEPTTVKILKVSSRTGDPLEGITFLVHKLTEGEDVSDYAYTGEEESPDGQISAVIDDSTTEYGKAEDGTKDNADEPDPESGGSEENSVSGNEDEEEDSQDSEDTVDEAGYPETDQTSGLDVEMLSADELFVTDENGEILVDYLDADSTYVIREIKAVPGYNLSHEMVSFAVDSEGLIDGSFMKEVTMENEPNLVHISKQDITNSEEIPGAQLTITDSEGTVVAQWTSTYEVHEIPALPAGTYILTEVTAPDGYEETESITFKVINSRKIQAVVMKDSPYREVEISKTDITGDKELAGAHLTITDKDGNEIESWESTAQVHTVKLHSGEYILTETKPADGYTTAESIPFTVIRTSADDFEVQGVTMKDDVTKVEITKSDITDGKPVIGAELIISDTDGNELYRWTTTKDPYYIEMLPIGTYTLTEIAAPSGYATAETVSFTVEDTGEIQKVDMKDIPISAEISKKDIADGPGGDELPGAHLTVKNEKGEVIDDWVSMKEPHKISMLPVGKYTLTEVTAPNGYELAETITFEITDSGEVHKVTMYDAPKEETVDLTGKKKKTTTNPTYTPGSPKGGTSIVAPVKTGDETPLGMFLAAALISLITAGGVLFFRRRKITSR